MKKIILILLVAFSIQLNSFAQNKAEPIPSVPLTNVKGEKVDLIDYAKNEKITVLTFWATWCGPCKITI